MAASFAASTIITLTAGSATVAGLANPLGALPYTKSLGFKQSFLSMINSITVELNGQSMVQQNQHIDIYNNFRLLTSESWTSQNRWSTIGFYPDLVSEAGLSTANNKYAPANTTVNNADTNEGLTVRLIYNNLDGADVSLAGVATSLVSNLISSDEIGRLYLSHVSNKRAGDDTVGLEKSPVVQYSVKATIMLTLFEVMPISKSLNFKIQIFWNNSAFTASHNGTAWTTQSAQGISILLH